MFYHLKEENFSVFFPKHRRHVLNFQIYYDTLICGAFFALTFISALSHALELRFYVDTTNWTMLAGYQPLIDAVTMKQMHTR